MSNDFLPEGYEQPKTSGKYMKFEKGENRFRTLSRPIVGWLDWDDKKPLRFKMQDKPAKPIKADQAIKHFWAFVVWDTKTSLIKILEITQATIQSAITALSKDADWGSPFDYDIKITKTGENLDTEYTITPAPKTPISDEIKKAYNPDAIKLELLYEGGDPFIGAVAPPTAEEDESEGLPF